MTSGVTTAPAAAREEVAFDAPGRLEALCDPGSFRALRTGVLSDRLGERARAGDGVLAGAGEVLGRPVFCYAQDPSFMGGSLGEAHADSIVRVMQLAGRAGAPVVGFIESGAPASRTGTRASRDTDGSSARASSSSPACPRSRSSPGSPPGVAPIRLR